MATKEYDVLMQRKKDNGDIEIHYPITQVENVVGLEEKLQTPANSKHPIPTVYATYVETVDGVDYYTATSDEITELYDKLIILLQLDKSNSGKVAVKINSFGNKDCKKINDGIESDFVNGDLNKKVTYSFQYNGGVFEYLGDNLQEIIASLNSNLTQVKEDVDSLNLNITTLNSDLTQTNAQLSNKVNIETPEIFSLPLASDFVHSSSRIFYWKNQFNEVTISGRARPITGNFMPAGAFDLAILPSGFRPAVATQSSSANLIASTTTISSTYATWVYLSIDGKITIDVFSGQSGASMVVFQASFVAAQ